MRSIIKFIIAGDLDFHLDRPETFMDLSEVDAFALLRWLDLEPAEYGYLVIQDLKARCRRRLWPEPRNFDPAIPASSEHAVGGRLRVVVAGRPAGFLRTKTAQLLALAERAPEGHILYS